MPPYAKGSPMYNLTEDMRKRQEDEQARQRYQYFKQQNDQKRVNLGIISSASAKQTEAYQKAQDEGRKYQAGEEVFGTSSAPKKDTATEYFTKRQKENADKKAKDELQNYYSTVDYYRNQSKQKIWERYSSNPSSVSKQEMEYALDERLNMPKFKYAETSTEFFNKKNATDMIKQTQVLDKAKAEAGVSTDKYHRYPKELIGENLLKNKDFAGLYNIVDKPAKYISDKDIKKLDQSKGKTLIKQADGKFVEVDTENIKDELKKGNYDNSSIGSKIVSGTGSFFNNAFSDIQSLGTGITKALNKAEDKTGVKIGKLFAPLKSEGSKNENALTDLQKERLNLSRMNSQMGTGALTGPGKDSFNENTQRIREIDQKLSELSKQKKSGDWVKSTKPADWKTASNEWKKMFQPTDGGIKGTVKTELDVLKAGGTGVKKSWNGDYVNNPEDRPTGEKTLVDGGWDPNSTGTKVWGFTGDVITDPMTYTSFGTEKLMVSGGEVVAKGISKQSGIRAFEKSMMKKAGNNYGKEGTYGMVYKQAVDEFRTNGGRISKDRLNQIHEDHLLKEARKNFDNAGTPDFNIKPQYPEGSLSPIRQANKDIKNLQTQKDRINNRDQILSDLPISEQKANYLNDLKAPNFNFRTTKQTFSGSGRTRYEVKADDGSEYYAYYEPDKNRIRDMGAFAGKDENKGKGMYNEGYKEVVRQIMNDHPNVDTRAHAHLISPKSSAGRGRFPSTIIEGGTNNGFKNYITKYLIDKDGNKIRYPDNELATGSKLSSMGLPRVDVDVQTNVHDILNDHFYGFNYSTKPTGLERTRGLAPMPESERALNEAVGRAGREYQSKFSTGLTEVPNMPMPKSKRAQNEWVQKIVQATKGTMATDKAILADIPGSLSKVDQQIASIEEAKKLAQSDRKLAGHQSLVEQTKQGIKDTYLSQGDNAKNFEGLKQLLHEDALSPVLKRTGVNFAGKEILPGELFSPLGKALDKAGNLPGIKQFNKLFNRGHNVGRSTGQKMLSEQYKADYNTSLVEDMSKQALDGISQDDIAQAWKYRNKPDEFTLPDSMAQERTITHPQTGEQMTVKPYDFIHERFGKNLTDIQTVHPNVVGPEGVNYTPGFYPKESEKALEKMGLLKPKQSYASLFESKKYPTPLDAEREAGLIAEKNLGRLLTGNTQDVQNAIAGKNVQSWKDTRKLLNPDSFTPQDLEQMDRMINPHNYYKIKSAPEKMWNNVSDTLRRLMLTTQSGTLMRNGYGGVVQENLDRGGNILSQAVDTVRGNMAPHIGIKLKNGEKLTAEQYKELSGLAGVQQGMGNTELGKNVWTKGEFGQQPMYKNLKYLSPTTYGEKGLQATESMVRNPTLVRALDKYGSNGINQAMEDVNRVHFNYNKNQSLTEFESRFMREVLPFYTWLRMSTPYYTKQALQHPGMTSAWGDKIFGLGNNKDDSRNNTSSVADYEQGRNLMSLGDNRFLKMNWNPVITTMESLQNPKNAITSGLNPMIKTAWDSFADNSISTGQDQTKGNSLERDAITGQGIAGLLDKYAPIVNKAMGIEHNNGPFASEGYDKPGFYQSQRAYNQTSNVLPFLGQWFGLARDSEAGGQKQSDRLLNMFGGIGKSTIDAGKRNKFGTSQAMDNLKKEMEKYGVIANGDYKDPNYQGPNYDTESQTMDIINNRKTAQGRIDAGQLDKPYTKKDKYGNIFTYDIFGNIVGWQAPYEAKSPAVQKAYDGYRKQVDEGVAKHEKDQANFDQYKGKNFEDIYRVLMGSDGVYPYENYSSRPSK